MNKNILNSLIAFGLSAGILSSCSKSEHTLNASVPAASFSYNMLTPTSDSADQNLELINTSTNSITSYWSVTDDQGNAIGTYTGDTVQLAIVFAGTYNVKMSAAGPGGLSDTIQQTVTIAKDNSYAVGPTTLLGILTGTGIGLTQRTWIPERVVNSVIVWDNYTDCLKQIDGGSGAYYAFGAAEIATDGTGRDGYFDDQYTFTFGKVGSLVYNDNNTVYLDDGTSGWTGALPAPWNTTSSTVSSTSLYNIVPALKPWASGTFTYSSNPAPSGAMKLGTITVKGVGAHIGLQDKANSGDEITPTASSVTYDVLRISTGLKDASTSATYDQIIIGITEPGVVWTFMLRSNR